MFIAVRALARWIAALRTSSMERLAADFFCLALEEEASLLAFLFRPPPGLGLDGLGDAFA